MSAAEVRGVQSSLVKADFGVGRSGSLTKVCHSVVWPRMVARCMALAKQLCFFEPQVPGAAAEATVVCVLCQVFYAKWVTVGKCPAGCCHH